MINASANFKNVVDSDSRSPVAKLLINGVVYGVSKIKSIKLTMGACGAQPLSGSLFIPSVEAVIVEELSSSVLEGKELVVTVGFRNLSSADVIQFGPFIVSSVANSNGETTINAIGTLSTFGSQTATVSSTDISDILDEVADFLENNVGVTMRLQGVTATGSLKEVPTGTWRDVMQEIAIALGGFVTEDYVGSWTIAKFASGSLVDVAPDRSQQPPIFEQTYTLEDTTVESGSIEMTMGNPLIEPWDVLNITDLDGNIHRLPCLNITHTFDGGLETAVEATVETAIQETAKIQGPVNGIVQHFWFDGAGAHVTQVEKQEYIDDPDSAGGNTLITADGMTVRDGTETLARFTKDLVQVGDPTGGRLSITSDGIDIYNDDAVKIFSAKDASGSSYQIATEEDYRANITHIEYVLKRVPITGQPIIVTAGWGAGGASGKGTFSFVAGTSANEQKTIEGRSLYCGYDATKNEIQVGIPSAVALFYSVTYSVSAAASYMMFGSRSGDLQGDFSGTIGEGLIAEYSNQIAVGMYNENLPDDIFEVGVGSDDTNRKTMFAVTGDGIYSAGHAEIDGTLSVGRKTLLDLTYPVGAIYMSVNSTSPATLFGGTWEQIKDRFLLAAGSTYGAGSANGQASVSYTPAGTVESHKLTVSEIPAHYHQIRYQNSSGSSGAGYAWGGSKMSWSAATESSTGMKGAGGGGSHSHGFTGTKATIATMPPYLTVYVWKRTA